MHVLLNQHMKFEAIVQCTVARFQAETASLLQERQAQAVWQLCTRPDARKACAAMPCSDEHPKKVL